MILIDNTVLSNFAQADAILLLKEYCQNNGWTTQEVLAEFENGLKQKIFKASLDLSWLHPIEQLTAEEQKIYLHLRHRLEPGEASCLAVAISRKCGFLSDDLDARKMTHQEGIPLSGSIGVLLELIQIGKLTLEEGNHLLTTFIHNGYFSPVRQLDEFFNS